MNDGIVTEKSIQLPGQEPGPVGLAGVDRAGATVKVVAVPPVLYIGVEILWTYLNVFFGLLAVDGLGLAELAPPGEAMSHLWNIGGIALAPTGLALGREVYEYLGKIRASRR